MDKFRVTAEDVAGEFGVSYSRIFGGWSGGVRTGGAPLRYFGFIFTESLVLHSPVIISRLGFVSKEVKWVYLGTRCHRGVGCTRSTLCIVGCHAQEGFGVVGFFASSEW